MSGTDGVITRAAVTATVQMSVVRTIALAASGEVYNFVEPRRELASWIAHYA